MSRPTIGNATRQSLVMKEAAFHAAAIEATSHTGDDLNDNPNALGDTEQMAEIARRFLSKLSPSLLDALDKHHDKKSALDRLVKIGRNVSSTMRHARRSSSILSINNEEAKDSGSADLKYPFSKEKIDASLGLLADECSDLAGILSGAEQRKVPKVRFGRTELQMPIVTLGCMRFQQSWNRGSDKDLVLDMSKVEDECQQNLIEIIRYAYQCGVTHIETAKGYGSSQLQLGFALKHLFDSDEIRREDLIIQTKGGISSGMSPENYKREVTRSIELLQLDYVDLFSMHGLNTEEEYSLLFENANGKGNLITALQELKAEGKIRHIGFSTHGPGSLIQKAIETDQFDYVNLHYHFCGSYTASGDLEYGGNLSNIRLAKKHDMGVFIISAYDKGGRLYAPSNKLRDLTLPDMEPMMYGSVWLWQHAMHDSEQAPIHTLVVGAARPSDLDQPVLASFSLLQDPEDLATRTKRVTHRLNEAMEESLGKDWVSTWHHGLPNAYESRYQTHLTGIVWIYNLIKAWGMLDFAKDRYAPMEDNLKKWVKKWDVKKSKDENLKKMAFGWTPGTAVDPSLNYDADLERCPTSNKERLAEAVQFVHDWASTRKKGESQEKPLDYEVAYDMRPWTAFPER